MAKKNERKFCVTVQLGIECKYFFIHPSAKVKFLYKMVSELTKISISNLSIRHNCSILKYKKILGDYKITSDFKLILCTRNSTKSKSTFLVESLSENLPLLEECFNSSKPLNKTDSPALETSSRCLQDQDNGQLLPYNKTSTFPEETKVQPKESMYVSIEECQDALVKLILPSINSHLKSFESNVVTTSSESESCTESSVVVLAGSSDCNSESESSFESKVVLSNSGCSSETGNTPELNVCPSSSECNSDSVITSESNIVPSSSDSKSTFKSNVVSSSSGCSSESENTSGLNLVSSSFGHNTERKSTFEFNANSRSFECSSDCSSESESSTVSDIIIVHCNFSYVFDADFGKKELKKGPSNHTETSQITEPLISDFLISDSKISGSPKSCNTSAALKNCSPRLIAKQTQTGLSPRTQSVVSPVPFTSSPAFVLPTSSMSPRSQSFMLPRQVSVSPKQQEESCTQPNTYSNKITEFQGHDDDVSSNQPTSQKSVTSNQTMECHNRENVSDTQITESLRQQYIHPNYIIVYSNQPDMFPSNIIIYSSQHCASQNQSIELSNDRGQVSESQINVPPNQPHESPNHITLTSNQPSVSPEEILVIPIQPCLPSNEIVSHNQLHATTSQVIESHSHSYEISNEINISSTQIYEPTNQIYAYLNTSNDYYSTPSDVYPCEANCTTGLVTMPPNTADGSFGAIYVPSTVSYWYLNTIYDSMNTEYDSLSAANISPNATYESSNQQKDSPA